MLKHVSNGYVANKLLNSSLPKVKDDDQAAKQFEEGFKISRNTMKIVGLIELTGSIFLLMSIFGKKFTRIGAVLANTILLGAIFKHFEANHGVKGAKSALTLFGLNTLNFIETYRK